MKNDIDLYGLGEFAAKTILEGQIQPDFRIENVRYNGSDIVFVDYANMFIRNIPNDLDENLLRQLTESLFSLVRSVKDYQEISKLRAGFTARGGILADILWQNLANKGFSSLSYKGLYNDKLQYDAINELSLEITTKQILQWKSASLNEVAIENFQTISSYYVSNIRKEMSSLSLFYLDRLYYSRCYDKLFEYFPEQIPVLIMNMGMSAFRNDYKYRAFGLLSKCIDMTKTDSEINKQCTKALNRLIHSKRLIPELKKLILDNMDNELFEFLWLLSDVDTFEQTLSKS